MPNIQQLDGPGQEISRRGGRSIGQIRSNTAVSLTSVEARAEIQAAKIDVMTAVTQRALQGAAYITNVEMTLAEACPAAMTRLKLIGDAGAMSLADIVGDTAHTMRQI